MITAPSTIKPKSIAPRLMRLPDTWDLTMWQMAGRPERSDPDELIYNLFHSSTMEKGYNFVGYINPDYDKVAEAIKSLGIELNKEDNGK